MEKICEHCKYCTWKYDAHVCFRENCISFTTRNSTCDQWEYKKQSYVSGEQDD